VIFFGLSGAPRTLRRVPGRFERVDVTSWAVVRVETIGDNEKYWLREPGGGEDRSQDWLFKPVVIAQNGHRQGEDWAEKIVSELAPLLGAPCADVDLAVRDGVEGSISRNVVPVPWAIVGGNVLLGEVVDGYRGAEPDATGRPRPIPGRPGHNLENIFAALRSCEPPAGGELQSAAELFARYLALDAWWPTRIGMIRTGLPSFM